MHPALGDRVGIHRHIVFAQRREGGAGG
jgi:hypothetical protein